MEYFLFTLNDDIRKFISDIIPFFSADDNHDTTIKVDSHLYWFHYNIVLLLSIPKRSYYNIILFCITIRKETRTSTLNIVKKFFGRKIQ